MIGCDCESQLAIFMSLCIFNLGFSSDFNLNLNQGDTTQKEIAGIALGQDQRPRAKMLIQQNALLTRSERRFLRMISFISPCSNDLNRDALSESLPIVHLPQNTA